jgi:hypothetical protein
MNDLLVGIETGMRLSSLLGHLKRPLNHWGKHKVDFASHGITEDNNGNSNDEVESRATDIGNGADEKMRWSSDGSKGTSKLTESGTVEKGVFRYIGLFGTMPRSFIRQLRQEASIILSRLVQY